MKVTIIIALLLCFSNKYAFAGESTQEQVAKEFSGTHFEVVSKIEAEVKRRAIVDQEFIYLLETSSDNDLKESIVEALEQSPTKKAVDALTKNLVTVQSLIGSGRGTDPHIGIYPCALALASIGSASVKSLVSLVETTKNPEERNVAVYTLMRILGAESAANMLQERITTVTSLETKQSLLSAIATIKRQ